MADDRQSLSTWIVLRVFAASFVMLTGLAMMFKSGYDWGMVLGAVFAGIGVTFFTLLWLYGRR
jgi:hypothetical protein